MDRRDCLVIGCGGCGGNQLNSLLNIDNRYTSLFFNTNLREMEILKNCNERNSFYISNADGTGKRRELAKKYFIEEQANIIETLSKFANQPYAFLLASADGGTGSTAIITLSKIIHRLTPEKKINIIATFPSLNAGRISFKNTLNFWNELMTLVSKHIINSIQFIDNNKPFSENKINEKAMKLFDKSFDMAQDNIDTSDLESCHNHTGYKAIFDIKNNNTSLIDGIIDFAEESVYYLPKPSDEDNVIYQCKKLIANVNKIYDKNELISMIEIFDDYKINATYDEDTMIIMSGCKIPKEPIELIKEALEEIENRVDSSYDDFDDDLFIETKKEDTELKELPVKKKKSTRMTKEELMEFLSDDL